MEEFDERFSRQIKKGVMEMLVLKLLSEKPGYGYELLTRLAEAPGGTLRIKEGTLYPILYRLEEEKMVCSGWQAGEGRSAPKKIYTLTDKGWKQLERQQKVWKQFREDVLFICGQEDDKDEI